MILCNKISKYNVEKVAETENQLFFIYYLKRVFKIVEIIGHQLKTFEGFSKNVSSTFNQ